LGGLCQLLWLGGGWRGLCQFEVGAGVLNGCSSSCYDGLHLLVLDDSPNC